MCVNDFTWAKYVSEFNGDFKNHYGDESEQGHFLKGDAQYSKTLYNFYKINTNNKIKSNIDKTCLFRTVNTKTELIVMYLLRYHYRKAKY